MPELVSGDFPTRRVFSRQREFSYGSCDGLHEALEEVPQKQREEGWAVQAVQLPQMAAVGEEWQ
jgi:hypothetical protein